MTDERNIPSRKVSPVAWVPTLYFAMGMPFVVLNMVCTLMYKGMGVSDAQIAFWTSLIMLPWTLKPLWSPFLEMYKTKKFFVVLTQLASGIGFALVAFALHLPDFFAITIAILAVIALSGATHDIAADGTYMSVLSKEEQAKWIGWQGAFYNIAKIAATGGLVYLAGVFIKHFGVTTAWMVIMLIIAVIMCALGLYHIFILLDRDEPWKPIYRSGPYLISPQKLYECVGDVPNVCFPCAELHDPATGRVAVYYGCADTVTGIAFGYIPEILEWTRKTSII